MHSLRHRHDVPVHTLAGRCIDLVLHCRHVAPRSVPLPFISGADRIQEQPLLAPAPPMAESVPSGNVCTIKKRPPHTGLPVTIRRNDHRLAPTPLLAAAGSVFAGVPDLQSVTLVERAAECIHDPGPNLLNQGARCFCRG
jgi:hypothetical protein